MRISDVSASRCFVKLGGRDAQVVRVTVDGAAPEARTTVRVECTEARRSQLWEGCLDPALAGEPGGPAWAPLADVGLVTSGRFSPRPELPPGVVVEIPIVFAQQPRTGTLVKASVTVRCGNETVQQESDLVVHEPGWRMIMVPHFHYDPVWWNTQAAYTSAWDDLLWALDRREPFQQSGLALVEAHLERARQDPLYRFVLAEVDYLKPFWDLYPDRRDEVRGLIGSGRLEIVGGTYNEPNTNLTGAETAIRVAVYGIGFQREVLGADPKTAWQLDVFAHDPQFPGIMAGCGLNSSAWARGPFHQWGPRRETGSNKWMQFPSEFEWLSPNGQGLLTCYMPNHYSAGWELEEASTVEGAMWRAYELFDDLAQVAASRVVMLPVGTDYTPPGQFVTDVARRWAARYMWPRFEVGLPKEFFGAVREELDRQGRRPSPQSRDMGPVYTGKEVSFIGTKQAQRLAEIWLAEAEHMSALSSAVGGPVAWRALDKAWRQVVFGAHHDGVTGSCSDQVYLDLMGGWREAYELARAVEAEARARFVAAVDTSGDGDALVVTNSLGNDRTGLAEIELARPVAGEHYEVTGPNGEPVAALWEPASTAGELRARFLARDVPGCGHRTFRLRRRTGGRPDNPAWEQTRGNCIANEHLEVEADESRGGGLCRVSSAAGNQLVPEGEVANELLLYPEYPDHPRFGEGPWHLSPSGPPERSGSSRARLRKEVSAIGERLIVQGTLHYGREGSATAPGSVGYRQTISLWHGMRALDLRTELHGWQGQDHLVRVRFPTVLQGASPVAAVGDAVIARSFALIDVDSAEAPWTLDSPAADWFGISTTLLLEVAGAQDQPVYHRRSLGVAEVITPALQGAAPWARDLLLALLQKGVTATCSEAPANRYGGLLGDSNLPDFRLAIGGPDENTFVAEVLSRAPVQYRTELDAQLRARGRASLFVPAERPLQELWRPNADLRGPRDLPVLVVMGQGARGTAGAVADLVAAVNEGSVVVAQPRELVPAPEEVPGWTAAVLNKGTPGFAVDCGAAMHLSLLRSCTGWPSGVWTDPPRRRAPDGSAFELEHWSHVFEYALLFEKGDWREASCVREAQGYNRPLRATRSAPHPGTIPGKAHIVTVTPRGGAGEVVLSALKPGGNPLAAGDPPAPRARDDAFDISLRFYEARGAPAEVELVTLPRPGSAWRTDLLEKPFEELKISTARVVADQGASSLRLSLRAGELATVRLQLPGTAPGRSAPSGASAHDVEVAQPVFSRYWLHNRGAAPMGNQSLAVHFRSSFATAGAGSTFIAQVHVASGAAKALQPGRLHMKGPDGWGLPPAETFSLSPGAFVAYDVETTVPARCHPGRYFVAAQLADGTGQVQEDVLTIDVVPSSSLVRQLDHLSDQVHSELEAQLLTEELVVPPGGSARLVLRLSNRTSGELRGEVQLISPVETWLFAGPSLQPFALSPGHHCEIGAAVTVPFGRCLSSWALFKVCYFGRIWYSPAAQLVLGERSQGERSQGDRSQRDRA